MVSTTLALDATLSSRLSSRSRSQYQDMKRLEREHAKEKQKLTKDKDSSKSQLTKANQAKAKIENLGRELQKVCNF